MSLWMNLTFYWLHPGWTRVDGTLIAVRVSGMRGTTQGAMVSNHECIVELTDPSGASTRLTVDHSTPLVSLPAVNTTVPVLLNKKGTKAVFDKGDPRLNSIALSTAREAKDKASFDEQLG